MRYTTLENISNNVIFHAFMDAFTVFRITTETTQESFCEMLAETCYLPEISVGAFDGDILASFVLMSPGKDGCAYIILTGTCPAYRRQGISTEIFQRIFAITKSAGFKSCRTEVKRNNAPAIALYQSLGFEIGPAITTTLKTPAGSREVLQYDIMRNL